MNKSIIIILMICICMCISISISVGVWYYTTKIKEEENVMDTDTDIDADIDTETRVDIETRVDTAMRTDTDMKKRIITYNKNCLAQSGDGKRIKVEACNEHDANQLFSYNSSTRFLKSNNGLCFDVQRNSKQNNAEIILYKCKTTKNDNQKWEYANNTFKVKHSGKCLELNDTSLKQYDCNNSNKQKFFMI